MIFVQNCKKIVEIILHTLTVCYVNLMGLLIDSLWGYSATVKKICEGLGKLCNNYKVEFKRVNIGFRGNLQYNILR